MQRLHRRHHALLCEARDIRHQQMLRVLHAMQGATIRIPAAGVGVGIEQQMVRLIPDCVHCHLKPEPVRQVHNRLKRFRVSRQLG